MGWRKTRLAVGLLFISCGGHGRRVVSDEVLNHQEPRGGRQHQLRIVTGTWFARHSARTRGTRCRLLGECCSWPCHYGGCRARSCTQPSATPQGTHAQSEWGGERAKRRGFGGGDHCGRVVESTHLVTETNHLCRWRGRRHPTRALCQRRLLCPPSWVQRTP